jgi:DNA (cytosine-5)-methyltransferase 1
MMRVLSLFAGIGGFDLGLERTGGFRTVAFCEIEPFPRAILKKHWPEVPCYDDVRTLTAAKLAADGITVDVICGGFPCQDLSEAGRRGGIEAERSGLWSEFARIIGEVRPRYAVVENVPELLAGPSEQPGGWFGRVLRDLAAIGYDAVWNCIQAADVGAPHIRDRVWIAAVLPDASCERFVECWRQQFQKSRVAPWNVSVWAHQPEPSGVADGVPHRMDRVRGTGNAVVPQIPELIGRAILEAEGLAA